MANARIQFSTALESTWDSVNPTLREGELVIVKKTNGKYKLVVGGPGGSTYKNSVVVWDEASAEEIKTATENYKTAAASSATAAAGSASSASTSASNATAQALAAKGSADTAKAQADRAANIVGDLPPDYVSGFTALSGQIAKLQELGFSVENGLVCQTYNV